MHDVETSQTMNGLDQRIYRHSIKTTVTESRKYMSVA